MKKEIRLVVLLCLTALTMFSLVACSDSVEEDKPSSSTTEYTTAETEKKGLTDEEIETIVVNKLYRKLKNEGNCDPDMCTYTITKIEEGSYPYQYVVRGRVYRYDSYGTYKGEDKFAAFIQEDGRCKIEFQL